MSSYQGKVLRANLSTGKITAEEIEPETMLMFGGGRGLGIRYLYKELASKTDPLSPENKLLFLTGPLAGNAGLSSSRWIVVAKSPMTNTYFRSSGGGEFGARMRFAGYDMFIIEGRADEPVYLSVTKAGGEIKPAKELWGMTTVACQESLKARHGEKVSIACIGPAAEKGVLYSIIIAGTRCAARGGMGTVMASKNLKAIVVDARQELNLPDPKGFKELVNQNLIATKGSLMFNTFSEAGTTMVMELVNVMGLYPVRNFREGSLDNWERIGTEAFADLKVKNTGCFGCIIHCGNIHKVKEGPYAGATNDGPEYETINMFSGTTGCTEIGAIVEADRLCDEFGIDTISTGGSIAFAYELFEKGILTKKDTDGLELTYGNHEAMIELIKMIGARKGLGDVLAEGVQRAAEKIGGEANRCAMHIKGLELPAYEPRAAKWHGLSYITSPIGASHNIGYCVQEIFNAPFPEPVDRFTESGYAQVVKHNQDSTAMYETGIICTFCTVMGMIPPLLFAKLMKSATGISEFGEPGYMALIGERIYNLERLFNLREGFGRKDDAYPDRFTKELLKKAGPAEGQVIKNVDGMLDEYYTIRGWDKAGVPSQEKLSQLGLSDV